MNIGADEPFEMWHRAAMAAAAEQANIGQDNIHGAGAPQKANIAGTDIRGQQGLDHAPQQRIGSAGHFEPQSRRRRLWGRIKKGMGHSRKAKDQNRETGE